MKFLIEKMFLLLLCILSMTDSEPALETIAGGLISVIAACFCQAAENRKPIRLICELCFGVLALIFPESSVFAALPLYGRRESGIFSAERLLFWGHSAVFYAAKAIFLYLLPHASWRCIWR